MDDVRRCYHLQLDRIWVRAMAALDRRDPVGEDVARQRQRELAAIDQALASLPVDACRARALAARLGLSPDEHELLWTAVAATIDPRVHPHLLALGGRDARRGLPLATHAELVGLDSARARTLAARLDGGPLVRDGLLAWADDDDAIAAARPLIASRRLAAWLAGDDGALDAGVRELYEPPTLILDDEQRQAVSWLANLLARPQAPAIVVEGAAGTGRGTAVAAAAASLGRRVIALDGRQVAPAELAAALRAVRREARLRDAIIAITDVDELAVPGDERALGRRLVEILGDWDDALVVTAGEGFAWPDPRPMVRARWPQPGALARRQLWRGALDARGLALDGEVVDALATRYALGPSGVEHAVAVAQLRSPAPAMRDLVEGVRQTVGERLGELATWKPVRHRWSDLVLAPDLHDQVWALIARVRNRHRVLEDWGLGAVGGGAGVAALLSGPPGTGKTMVAGLIAAELGLELYQVDLSRIVSKWVGETEKQLARVFAAAETGNALLLFDEADSLFSKRTEVKGANDRYANLEVNYLLQRIEAFSGVAVLTTNLDASIDPAFKRRLAAHVVFWPPDVDERTRLWASFLATGAPVADDLDPGELAARFSEMTGANIRNAVLAAAYVAADRGAPISQALLHQAARGEYLAMGRVIAARRN